MTPAKSEPIDLADVDLALLGFAGVGDVHARQEAERNRLLGDGEGAGDDRLAGDHRHQGCKHHEGISAQDGAIRKKGLVHGLRIGMTKAPWPR